MIPRFKFKVTPDAELQRIVAGGLRPAPRTIEAERQGLVAMTYREE